MTSTSDQAAFGGAPFRDRFTDAIWQGPTWSFAILLIMVSAGDRPGVTERAWLWGGFVLVMAATTISVLVHWDRVPPWTQASVPAASLIGAAAMTVAVAGPRAPYTILLLTLPTVWLAFEFGSKGVCAAVGIVPAVVVLTLATDGDRVEQIAVVIPALFLIGLAVVSRLMSRVLHRVGRTLRSQEDDLREALELARSRLVVLNGVMESINVGVTVLRPGQAPLSNDYSERLTRRAGGDPQRPHAPSDHLFSSDGHTSVPGPDQAMVRAAAGEEFTGLIQRIGEHGDQRATVTSAHRLVDDDGRAMGSVVAVWDATELMHAIEVREEFVTTVSHELRTPLTAITASLELLADLAHSGDPEADSPQLLSSSLRNAHLLGARIAELMASAPASDLPVAPRRTDVTDLVRVALTKHDAAIEHAGLALRVELPGQIIAEVDPTRFEQVVDNLVSNAVKYTAGGEVRVSLHPNPESFVLAVADTGMGMTRDELRQAYTRFYRGPAAKTTAVRGLGIGLNLVKIIVEKHSGDVKIDSTPGAGTSVLVSIPLAATQRSMA